MKIALICPSDFTVYLCCKWIIKYLNNKGHKIYILAPKSSDKYFYREILKLNVQFIEVKMNRHINIIDDLIYILSLILIFRKNKINSIFCACTKPNLYAPLAAKIAKIKNINISIWGRGTIFLDKRSLKLKVLKYLILRLYRLSFHLSNKIWFTNKNDLSYFESKKIINSNKVILTKNYIDSEEYKQNNINYDKKKLLRKELNLTTKDIVIILVGRMIFSKGIKEFFEASIIVNKLYPNSKFLLIGAEEKNNPDSVPKDYLKKINNYSHFKWLGFRRDIKELYSISKIAVLPSYYPEGGYPRAITEPMSMSMAVIAANTKDCSGAIENNINGLLVEPKNSIDLSKKVISLISDPKKIKFLGKEARKAVLSKFDEEIVIKELINSLY